LAGVPLLGVGVPDDHAQVCAVVLETEDALDDIRVEFSSGWTVQLQAKRRLEKGEPLTAAAAQWVEAARGSLDPERERLVVAAGSLSDSVKDMQRALERHKADVVGPPTEREAVALRYLDDLLDGLTDEQRAAVLKCAVIWELAVEEPHEMGARQAASYLTRVLAAGCEDDGLTAWNHLVRLAGRAARLRSGYRLEGWLDGLRGAGARVTSVGGTPAAKLQRRREALDRYRDRLRREGSIVDLRGLGAEIPALPVDQVDAEVRIAIGSDDSSKNRHLLWTLLRRGRVVVTGLPGGGKSVAIRMLAARLCDVPAAPLPVRVSLADIDAQDRSVGFRDRLLSAALRDDRTEDRPRLREELERRFDVGGCALLLDSLDETYDRRGEVVAEVEAFLAGVSPDVDVLIATRDVAYGHAATLGWDSLELLPPLHPEKIVGAVLRQYAVRVGVAENRVERWVANRAGWVAQALTGESTLSETPLLPVLLALLAATRNEASLPSSRAHALEAVVRDVLTRRELKRRGTASFSGLSGTQAQSAAMDAFVSEASAILDANGQIPVSDLSPIVAADLTERWGLSPGPAEAAAQDMIHFLDESGIFVISGASETVAPRLALFAEIGDAIRAATTGSSQLDAWTEARIHSGQLEPLVLAASLSPRAAENLGRAAGQSRDRKLLHAAVRAHAEHAELGEENVQAICAALITDLQTGDPLSWDSWRQLLKLPITADMRADIEQAAAAYAAAHQTLVRAELDLRLRTREELQGEPSSLLDVLALQQLPGRAPRPPHGTVHFEDLLMHSSLTSTQAAAADVLLGAVPEATTLIIERATRAAARFSTVGLSEDLTLLLQERGFVEEAQAVRAHTRSNALDGLEWWRNYDHDANRRVLAVLADRPAEELNYQERTRLDELADLLETLDLNDISSQHMLKQVDVLPSVVELVATLHGFNLALLAAQATLTLERMDAVEGSEPYYVLFAWAQERTTADWATVSGVEQAVRLLVPILTWGMASAEVAARALWAAPPPVRDIAAPLLRELLPRLTSSPRHERLAAYTLCSLEVDGPEPAVWLDSDDPVLRAVLARTCPSADDNYLSPELVRLLDDPDGHVRKAAIKRVHELGPPDLDQVLAAQAAAPKPGWMCLYCRTPNPPGASGCTKDRCFGSGPDPSALATQLRTDPGDQCED
jgi:hypothetical protein